jgi:hypothetical protein
MALAVGTPVWYSIDVAGSGVVERDIGSGYLEVRDRAGTLHAILQTNLQVLEPAPPVTPPPVEPPVPPVVEPPPASYDGVVANTSAFIAAAKAGAGKTYLVNGVMGQVNLSGAQPTSPVTFIGAPGSRVESVFFQKTKNITLRGMRVGGTSGARVRPRALIDVADSCANLVVERSDLGWTLAATGGSQGYGVRAVNGNSPIIDGLRVSNCKLHHIAADAFQIAGVKGLVVERNDIGYVAAEAGSSEHSDSLQLMGLAGPARIVRNHIHHVGFFDEQHRPDDGYPAGQLIVHGWLGSTPVLFEDNYIHDCRNYQPMFKAESDGKAASGWSFNRNTIVRCGPPQPSANRAGFWRGTHALTNNVLARVEGNAVFNPNVGNLIGSTPSLDADGRCLSNPNVGISQKAGPDW